MALEWHRTRQLHPHRFTSVLRNKIRYARYGAQHLFALRGLLRRLGLDREVRRPIMATALFAHPTHRAPTPSRAPRPIWQERDFSTLCSQLTIEADGIPVTLPPGTEGVIILNIPSYGGGSDLWGAELGDLWNADEDTAGELRRHSPPSQPHCPQRHAAHYPPPHTTCRASHTLATHARHTRSQDRTRRPHARAPPRRTICRRAVATASSRPQCTPRSLCMAPPSAMAAAAARSHVLRATGAYRARVRGRRSRGRAAPRPRATRAAGCRARARGEG